MPRRLADPIRRSSPIVCAAYGSPAVERLIAEHVEVKLPDLLQTVADCPKARSVSIRDRFEAK